MADLQQLSISTKSITNSLTEVLNKVHAAVTAARPELNNTVPASKIGGQGLNAAKLRELRRDVETIIMRLRKLRIPQNVYIHSLVLLKRSVEKYLLSRAETCSRTKLKYILISCILVSCKMLLEDEKRSAASFASIFRYEASRIIRNERAIVVDLLGFDVNVTCEEYQKEIAESHTFHKESLLKSLSI